MTMPFIVLISLLGLIFGSFFNVVGLRLPKKIPFANDRSVCPNCNHTLSWYELIPVFSYIIQGGKCRHCAVKISPVYPMIELATSFLFAFSYTVFGFTTELIVALLLVSMLMILFVSDLKYMLIPNKILLFFLPLFIILRVIEPLDPWWSPIVGGLIGFVLIAVIILASRGGMGAGDMKLFGLLGIVLGLKKILLAFFISCMVGAVIGTVLLMMKMINRKQAIPFGPYIVIGTLVTYFYGDALIDWYFNYF